MRAAKGGDAEKTPPTSQLGEGGAEVLGAESLFVNIINQR